MLIKLPTGNHHPGMKVSLRCPACRQNGTFDPYPNISTIMDPTQQYWFSQLRCPNPSCHVHIFCVHSSTGYVHKSYPGQRIDFDPKEIPGPVLKTLSEAITCHAEGCFVASAIMVRRTLEELCADKGAEGRDLRTRIQGLQGKVILPTELFSALDDLRLLGNDAAHIEATTYDSIGSEEAEASIEVTKEILKAVYQLDDLVGRLRALKKN